MQVVPRLRTRSASHRANRNAEEAPARRKTGEKLGQLASTLRGFGACAPLPPFFRKIHLPKDLASFSTVFANFVRNMLYSENSKYRDVVYYFLVITPFCVVLRITAACHLPSSP